MHDIGLHLPYEDPELPEARRVAHGAQLAREVSHHMDPDGFAGLAFRGPLLSGLAARVERLDPLEQRALGAVDRAEGEVDLVPEPCLALAAEDGVLLAAAEDEPG